MYRRAYEALRDDAVAACGDEAALDAIAGRARAQLLELHPKRRLVPTRKGQGKVLVAKASADQLLWALDIAATQADSRAAKQRCDGFNRIERVFKRAAEFASAGALRAFKAGTRDESWLQEFPRHVDPRAATVQGKSVATAAATPSTACVAPEWTVAFMPAGTGASGAAGFADGAEAAVEVDGGASGAPRTSTQILSPFCEDAAAIAGPGDVVEIRECPGCLILPNSLSAREQDLWLHRVLTQYVEPSFERNIDADGSAPEAARARAEAGVKEPTVWERACAEWSRADADDRDDPTVPLGRSLAELRHITWATVGLRYDWTARAYEGLKRGEDGKPTMGDSEPACIQPPAEISDWARRVSISAGMPMSPEAGIVNLYHTTPAQGERPSAVTPKAGSGNTMGGHKDDAELATDKPVISMSVGCTCVFLMGGLSREAEPVPILLRSGDVLVMGGEARLCFHGVACAIPHTAPQELCDSWAEGPSKALAKEAVQTMRVNINARQVFV